MELGVERIRTCLDALETRRLQSATVQVVGTNGKGSTSSFLASLARAHGLRAGLFTSPHFLSPRERILVDGRMLPEEAWADLASRVFATRAADCLTYFEVVTAMCSLAFADTAVDLAVFETGLGGRYDATTAMEADLVLFTPIGTDHEAVLGDTPEAIATDKAHAMRLKGKALTAPQRHGARRAMEKVAAARKAELLGMEDVVAFDPAKGMALAPVGGLDLEVMNVELGLEGPHQYVNAHLALAAWVDLAERFGWPVDPEACRRGLALAFLAGRLQRVEAKHGAHPDLILDGAHNLDACQALARALTSLSIRPGCAVFSCLRDKPLAKMAPLVLEMVDGPVYVPPIGSNRRALAVEDIATALGNRARPMPDMASALRAALGHQGPTLICGSLYLLAEYFSLHPDTLRIECTDRVPGPLPARA